MAYEDKNWSFEPTPCTYGSGGSANVLYIGRGITADAAAAVEAANYFNPAAARIPDGGYAIVSAIVGVGGTVKMKQYMLSRAAGVVTATLLATTAG